MNQLGLWNDHPEMDVDCVPPPAGAGARAPLRLWLLAAAGVACACAWAVLHGDNMLPESAYNVIICIVGILGIVGACSKFDIV